MTIELGRYPDSNPDKTTQKPENSRHVTIELGCGEAPLPIRTPMGKFSGRNYYIGIDLPPEVQEYVYKDSISGPPNDGLPQAVKEIALYVSPEEQRNILLVAGDILSKQPIRDKSADEVFISNVLNDPLFHQKKNKWYDFQGLFEKIGRILKPTGRLVIYTSYPPFNEKRVKKLLKDNNYVIQSEHSAENQSNLEIIYEYDVTASGQEYLIIATQAQGSD